MTTRRPLQPLSTLSPNVVATSYMHSTNGVANMNDPAQDDTDALGDDLSLTSKDADDDFDRVMLQARDERRLNDARHGRVQAFRNARTHPRVGVTLENLERHNASTDAPAKFESPSSSSGSALSDPAIQPPTGWGRKGRVKRNWMRTITSDEERTPEAHEHTVDRLDHREQTTPRADADDADAPRASVEDSPLSHKSSLHGTPVVSRPRSDDWDFDLNEASLIASTPYLPRNTALDDIRQREIESLLEQGVTKNRLDRIRETSPEELRRPPSSRSSPSPEKRVRTRTNSWQKISRSPAIAGEGFEHSPITVYKKSTETVGVINRQLLANAQGGSKRPSHRREDSQDLLRRLARVSSNTPSPGRNTTSRPQIAPARQPNSSSQTMVTERTPTPPSAEHSAPAVEPATGSHNKEVSAAAAETHSERARKGEEPSNSHAAPASLQEPQAEDVDATPMPAERSMLNPKTPVVTGAWIDTPRPATAARPKERVRSRSRSPKKGSPVKKIAENQPPAPIDDEPQPSSPNFVRPTLPGSVLEAVVEDARANGDRQPNDFGDSTINSLEELIAPFDDYSGVDNQDDDTLQDLHLPIGVPRNEAERRRQQELLQLHRMNERLRTARTNIRDASRGIKRCENRVDHVEETVVDGEPVRVVYRDCPCAVNGGHQSQDWSVWKGFKSLFYDERLKPKRRGWGLTILSIVLIAFLAWLVLENTACEIWCHYEYASSYKGYGITWNAPKYPYVIPTVIYRNFIKPWWRPLWAFVVFTYKTLVGCFFSYEDVDREARRETVSRVATEILLREEEERVLGMGADEVVR
ncbi:hypothetical protein K458DRAFT_415455, partial [Lentithecium fluviatile CBS 122367]